MRPFILAVLDHSSLVNSRCSVYFSNVMFIRCLLNTLCILAADIKTTLPMLYYVPQPLLIDSSSRDEYNE